MHSMLLLALRDTLLTRAREKGTAKDEHKRHILGFYAHIAETPTG
jgi:hypothetical protein